MGGSGKAKRLRREAREKIEKERQKVIDQMENLDITDWTPEQVGAHLRKMLDDPIGLDYMVGKAIKEKNDGMLQIIRNYKATGFLPDITLISKPEEKEKDVPIQ